MPREAIHWTVLTRALKRLERPPFNNLGEGGEELRRQIEGALFLGAMAHDAPYYYQFGGAGFEAVAEVLHGSGGQNTFEPLRSVAAAITERPAAERPVLWAFLLGMISHYAVDIVFHPMIYFFTGDYYDPDSQRRLAARARHRLLETYLDSWAMPKLAGKKSLSLNGTLKLLGAGAKPVCTVLGRTLTHAPGVSAASCWHSALRYLCDLQAVFHSDFAGKIFRVCTKLSGGRLFPIDALFIYGRRKPEPLLDQKLTYINPATGERFERSADELLKEAEDKCVELFELTAPLISGDTTDVASALGSVKGESLNFGIPGAVYGDAKHFSADGLPLPGLNLKAR